MAKTKVDEMDTPATKADIGKQVIIPQGIGEDPLYGIITKVDELTGLVIEVLIKDPVRESYILNVKDKIVIAIKQAYTYLPLGKMLWAFLVSLWNRIFKKNKQ